MILLIYRITRYPKLQNEWNELQMNEKMMEQIENFNRTTHANIDTMLCDEIGMYTHIVATLRHYAKSLNMTNEYERFDTLHKKSFAMMTMKYFNNVDETLQYLTNEY